MKLELNSRESYVIAAALYREIKRQTSLSDEQQEWADLEDMKELLERHFLNMAALLATMDRAAGHVPVDLVGDAHLGN